LKRILVIDDEPDVLQIVRAMLVTRNFDVALAEGGEEGLKLAAETRPDLIVLDLMMPRVSGLEVLKRLRKDNVLRMIPIVIISALGDEQRPPDFWTKTLGVADYIQKPFDPLELIGKVESVLRRLDYKSPKVMTDMSTDAVRPVRGSGPADTLPIVDLTTATPSEVVEAFVESWNTQNFALEYQCLGDEMRGGLKVHDYVSRRRQSYIEEKGNTRTQRLVKIEQEKISLNMAKVVVLREDVINNQPKPRMEAFSLKKTHEGWKIVTFKTQRPATVSEPG
jgi:DNA-binding response OmpR family regulator